MNDLEEYLRTFTEKERAKLCAPFHKKTVAEALDFMAEFGATVKLIAVPKGSRLVTGHFLMFGEKPAKKLTELERIFFLNSINF